MRLKENEKNCYNTKNGEWKIVSLFVKYCCDLIQMQTFYQNCIEGVPSK